MTPQQAELVINEYGRVLARATDGGIARRLSWLPYSICKIRLAFYVYLGELIEHRLLTQKMGDNLKATHHALNQFVADDDADLINDLNRQSKSGTTATALTSAQQEIMWEFMARMSNTDNLELNSYINECFGHRDNQDFLLRKSPAESISQ